MNMFVLSGPVGNYINLDGNEYSYFAGNNYLGMANHPLLKKEAVTAIEKYGIGFSASRETTGTSELHLELEKMLSKFKDRENSAVFASGYIGNKILLELLKDRYDAVYLDEASHPSILDGIPADIRNIFTYEHLNTEHLELLIKKNRKNRPLIITDGLFALTGEIAPLDKIYEIAQHYEALIVVDDAHSTGVLGNNGRGTPEHFDLDKSPGIFQTETMSKALGVYGGFISSSEEVIRDIREKSAVYIGSTALPVPITAAACASVKILIEYPELRSRLYENSRYSRGKIKRMDFSTTYDKTPIIPIFFDTEEKAKRLSEFLKGNKIIAPYIKYPVKMEKFLVRITMSAIHTRNQIEKLLSILKEWRDKYGVN